MQTTITIDDEILEQLKARAAKEGTTVSQLIEDSVRLAAQSKDGVAVSQAFELITFGRGGHFTGANVDRVSDLTEEDDFARYGRRRLPLLDP
jgi:hypothetical protein